MSPGSTTSGLYQETPQKFDLDPKAAAHIYAPQTADASKQVNYTTAGSPNSPIFKSLVGLEQEALARIHAIVSYAETELAILGSSREISLAKTKLEEALMWARQHIAKTGV